MKFLDVPRLQRNQLDWFVRQISHMKLIPVFSMQAPFGSFAVWISFLAIHTEVFCLAIDISLELIHFWLVKKGFPFALQSISYRIQTDLMAKSTNLQIYMKKKIVI